MRGSRSHPYQSNFYMRDDFILPDSLYGHLKGIPKGVRRHTAGVRRRHFGSVIGKPPQFFVLEILERCLIYHGSRRIWLEAYSILALSVTTSFAAIGVIRRPKPRQTRSAGAVLPNEESCIHQIKLFRRVNPHGAWAFDICRIGNNLAEIRPPHICHEVVDVLPEIPMDDLVRFLRRYDISVGFPGIGYDHCLPILVL